MHVVFRWCTNQRSPSPKGKKSIWNHPHNQSSNRYRNIYFNNPLKLKQAYYGSMGKKGVIDVMNFLCGQLYLLLDDIKATLEASSVNERRWSSTRYCPTWGQPYGQSRVLMRLFFLPILRYQQHMWPNHKLHSTVLQIMYLVLLQISPVGPHAPGQAAHLLGFGSSKSVRQVDWRSPGRGREELAKFGYSS